MSRGQAPVTCPAAGAMPCPAASPADCRALWPDAYSEVMRRMRVLAALREELAAQGVTTDGMVATRLQATLNLPGGPTVTCRGGWLSWPAPGPGSHVGAAYEVHWADDLAGATGRLTNRSDS
jgi:hypothetical protein